MIGRFVRAAGLQVILLGSVAVGATFVALMLRVLHGTDVLIFIATAVALAGLAAVVGEATDELGARMGPAATGFLQSALGNLPELFISIFAINAGLVVVVQTALIGSVLANALLVLGLAFVVGGLRHGTLKFEAATTRMTAMLLVLAVASLAIPTLATAPGAPDYGHTVDLSVITAIVLLVVFAASIPTAVRGTFGPAHSAHPAEGAWPLAASIAVLGAAGLGAALVSDWFVEALRPAMADLGISEEFVGLVVVAIAGNAVENVVGVLAAARNQADLAVSLILNSALQVALLLTPVLVLLSILLGGPALTLSTQLLLIAALGLAALLAALIVFDGEATWLEGLALIGLYVIIAASVWYGPPVAGS